MLRYCARCVMPDTKPDLQFDAEGVCSACRAYQARAEIDWTARRAELEKDPAYVADILRRGNARANEVAEQTLDEVRERMGMVYT